MEPKDIIIKLGLSPHPEGGHYKELFRSAETVAYRGNPCRAAFTSIYFLLEEDEVSRWHEVDADEAWHFYDGDPLELLMMDPEFRNIEIITLGMATKGFRQVFTVPAGWWQAARSTGKFSLCGCTVSPGFEFSGFRFLNEIEKHQVHQNFPDYSVFL